VSRLIALAGVVGSLMMSAPQSWAAPDDEVAPEGEDVVDSSMTLALTDLGSAPTLTFYGLQDTVQLSLPVPDGSTPAALNVTVELPFNPRPGVIAVTQDERTISRVGLPEIDYTPIVIPLAGAEVIGGWVTVVVRTNLWPSEDYCIGPTYPLRLINGSISYAGTAQPPATVAHFLPPVLEKLTIFLPQSPSAAESDATVQLTTAVAAHYGKQAPAIAANPLIDGQTAPPAPPGPLERQIVITEAPENQLSLQGAPEARWLLIAGASGELRNQTKLLSSEIARLAFPPKAVVGQLSSSHHLPGDVTTLRALGRLFRLDGGLV